MRIVIDYRPALRARSGAGEYVHQLARHFCIAYPDDRVTLFTSSWKDRPSSQLASEIPGAALSDHRVPVRALNFAWHRLEWPAVETLIHAPVDIAFSPHPLLMPSRTAAQVITIHDLDFLDAPERTHGEIRRDYVPLAAAHARRAARVIVSSHNTAAEVMRRFDLPATKIAICPAGVPEWTGTTRGFDPRGYLLFIGTLGQRKNVGGLLAAYAQLLEENVPLPRLLLVGATAEDSEQHLQRIRRAPLSGRVEYRGYVSDDERQAIYTGARALILPSFHEGFGMTALEAMSLGVPVIASARGALPELVGDAALLINPDDQSSLADALRRVANDDDTAQRLSAGGMARAREFSWQRTAHLVRQVFADLAPQAQT